MSDMKEVLEKLEHLNGEVFETKARLIDLAEQLRLFEARQKGTMR